jgi:hypothetical protein
LKFSETLTQVYACDWRIFMTAASQWWQGGDPYGVLSPEYGLPGAFAYPPTALTWLIVFLQLGGAGFYVWTALQLGGWWILVRRTPGLHPVLLLWTPLIIHLWLGQSTLAVVLVLWAATMAKRRGFWWGMALAWSLTKPQAALLPIAWILWRDRVQVHRHHLWLGIAAGTAALALPPMMMDPGIWLDWFHSLSAYRSRVLQVAPWQGFGAPILLLALGLWYHRHRRQRSDPGWQWLLSAAVFPQTSLYASVILMPVLRPQMNYWTIAGLGLSALLVGPASQITLPIILSGHILAAWFITGGPGMENRHSG